MKALGEKSYTSIIVRIVILFAAIFTCLFFNEICLGFYRVMLFTKDLQAIAEYEALMDKYAHVFPKMALYFSDNNNNFLYVSYS